MAIQKILVPIDITDKDQQILDFIGKQVPEGTEIRLLHVLQYPIIPGNYLHPVDSFADMFTKIRKITEEKIAKIAASKALAGLKVSTEILDEPGADIGRLVGEYAADSKMDLVLLVSRHRRGLDNIFSGSNLMRIIRECKVPMLVMSPEKLQPIHRIGYATDFSEFSGKVMQPILEMARFFKAGITCYKVNTLDDFQDQRKFVEERNAFINSVSLADIPEIKLYNAWDLEAGILHGAEDHAADTIAMATHARKGVPRIFNGSVTEKVVKATSHPVLIFNLENV